MTVTVILCTYNRSRLLARVLDQLAAQQTPENLRWEALIVDNNSTDGTAELVRTFVQHDPGRFRYLHVARQGKSWALNAALEAVESEVLVFTDDDVELDPEWLQELTRPFSDPACMGAGGRILPAFIHGQPSWLRGPLFGELLAPLVVFDHGEQTKPLRTAPYGANMAFRREIFQRHARFRTDLGPNGLNVAKGEDIELAGRVVEAGEPTVYVPSALVRHPVEPERLRRGYFWSWWFETGRTRVLIEGIPANAVRYLGVPRYLLRQVCSSAARALLSRDEKQRFCYALQVARACGAASAALSHRDRPRNPPSV